MYTYMYLCTRKFLKVGYKGARDRLHSVVPSNRSRAVCTHWNTRGSFWMFSLWQWSRTSTGFLWAFARSPSWEILKSHLDALLGKPAVGDPSSAGRFDQVISRVPTSTILWKFNLIRLNNCKGWIIVLEEVTGVNILLAENLHVGWVLR